MEINLFLSIIISFLLGYLVSTLLKEKGQKRPGEYIKGINYLLNQKDNEALKEFIKIAKIDSENAEVYILLGNLYRKRGELEKAIRIHQSILVQSNLNKEVKKVALYNLAIDFEKSGFLKRALDVLDKLEKFDKRFSLGLQKKAKIYILLKDWENAINVYKKLSKYNHEFSLKTYSSLYVELAKSFIVKSNFLKSKFFLKKSLSIYSNNPYALSILGNLYFKRGKLEKAKEFYEQAIKENPNSYLKLRTKLNKIMENPFELLDRDSILYIYFKLRNFVKNSELEKGLIYLDEKIEKFPEYKLLPMYYILLICLKENNLKKFKKLKKHINLKFCCNCCNISINYFSWQCPNCNEFLSFKTIA
jgi:lipopolysaccharide biosynthesis regulator YciM